MVIGRFQIFVFQSSHVQLLFLQVTRKYLSLHGCRNASPIRCRACPGICNCVAQDLPETRLESTIRLIVDELGNSTNVRVLVTLVTLASNHMLVS